MKINVNQKLVFIDGKPLKENRPDPNHKGKFIESDILLKDVLVNSLLMENPQKQSSGIDKIRKYTLATKIHKTKQDIDLPVDDVKFIKDLAIEAYGPLIAGQVNNILEGKKDE